MIPLSEVYDLLKKADDDGCRRIDMSWHINMKYAGSLPINERITGDPVLFNIRVIQYEGDSAAEMQGKQVILRGGWTKDDYYISNYGKVFTLNREVPDFGDDQ